MRALSVVVFIVLSAIAALHAYWGLGGLWPGNDVRSLIDTVIGDPRFNALPPSWMTFTLTALIFASALFALAAPLRMVGPVRAITKAALAVIALVFLARGVSGYALSEAIRAQMSEPFATYDQLYYSPLCLILGAAFVVLFLAKPRTVKDPRL